MSDRIAAARAEIARREALARATELGRWNAPYITANDPAHVLAVLAAARGTLDRHRSHHSGEPWCSTCTADWPCPDAVAVLDIYAPEASDE